MHRTSLRTCKFVSIPIFKVIFVKLRQVSFLPHREQAKKLNTINLWSQSLTKDYLTEYAEGLACANFDRRMYYLHRKISHNTWYVMHESYLSMDPTIKHKGLCYKRVRKVTIDAEGYMSCSCGYVQRMMMPCSHICCLFQSIEEYHPTMFHIRWHKLFLYYYRNPSIVSTCKDTCAAIEKIFDVTREYAYDNNGKYKGIYVIKSLFGKRIQEDVCDKDSVFDRMVEVYNQILTMGPIKLTDSVKSTQTQSLGNNGTVDGVNKCQDSTNISVFTEFGGSSQQEGNLSQIAMEYVTDKDSQGKDTSYYNEALPLFQDMISTCKDRESLDRCMETMRNATIENLAKNRVIKESITGKSIHLFAEDLTNQKRQKRKMTIGEKILRKKC